MVCGQGEEGSRSGANASLFLKQYLRHSRWLWVRSCPHAHTHTHITYTHCRHPSLWVKWNHVPLRDYLTSNGQVIYTLLQVFFLLTPHSSMLCFLKPFMLHWYNQGLLLVLCAFCNNHFLRLLLKLCTESSIGCKIVVIFLSGDFRWSGKQNSVWISH